MINAQEGRPHLGYINRADLDDPFLRPDQWDQARKLLKHHRGRVRIVICRIPGPHPGVPCYSLGKLSGLEALSAAFYATLKAIDGGRYSWGCAEQTDTGELFTGMDDAGSPEFRSCGIGPHLMAIIGPDHPLPENIQVYSCKTVSSAAEVAHTMRYGHKGYNASMNSVLHDFKAGSFTPPCPIALALGVMEREDVRRELWQAKAEGRRKSTYFPRMRDTLHAPRKPKVKGSVRYGEDRELEEHIARDQCGPQVRTPEA